MFAYALFAQSSDWDQLFRGTLAAVTFGLIGLALLLSGYFAFDHLTKKVDVQEQLNKGNTAVAIVVAALLLAMAYIVAHVVH